MALSARLIRCCGTLLILSIASVCAAGPVVSGMDDWLLMVRTVNTDPARERDFNDWYDRIDVPDVLQVPGFVRARRGALQGDGPPVEAPATPDGASGTSAPARAAAVAGRYVALYDIESRAIDKTIIDMLMATWKMITTGRDTPLLKVEERVYYHRMGSPLIGRADAASRPASCLVLDRFDRRPGTPAAGFNRAYEAALRAQLRQSPVILRATRYALYRVLMFEPRSAPQYLTIYELDCGTGSDAAGLAQRLRAEHEAGGTKTGSRTEVLSYRQIGDVRRSSP